MPCPSPRDLPNPGIEPVESPTSSGSQADFLPVSHLGSPETQFPGLQKQGGGYLLYEIKIIKIMWREKKTHFCTWAITSPSINISLVVFTMLIGILYIIQKYLPPNPFRCFCQLDKDINYYTLNQINDTHISYLTDKKSVPT